MEEKKKEKGKPVNPCMAFVFVFFLFLLDFSFSSSFPVVGGAMGTVMCNSCSLFLFLGHVHTSLSLFFFFCCIVFLESLNPVIITVFFFCVHKELSPLAIVEEVL